MEHDTTWRGPGPGPRCHHPDISHLGSAAWLLVPGYIGTGEGRGEKRGCFVTRNPVPHPALGSRHVPPLAHIPGPRGTMGQWAEQCPPTHAAAWWTIVCRPTP